MTNSKVKDNSNNFLPGPTSAAKRNPAAMAIIAIPIAFVTNVEALIVSGDWRKLVTLSQSFLIFS